MAGFLLYLFHWAFPTLNFGEPFVISTMIICPKKSDGNTGALDSCIDFQMLAWFHEWPILLTSMQIYDLNIEPESPCFPSCFLNCFTNSRLIFIAVSSLPPLPRWGNSHLCSSMLLLIRSFHAVALDSGNPVHFSHFFFFSVTVNKIPDRGKKMYGGKDWFIFAHRFERIPWHGSHSSAAYVGGGTLW